MNLRKITASLSGINRWNPLLQNLYDEMAPICREVQLSGDGLFISVSASGLKPVSAGFELTHEQNIILKSGAKFNFSLSLTEDVLTADEWSLFGHILNICVATIVTTSRLGSISHDAWKKISHSQEPCPESFSESMNLCISKSRLVAPHDTTVLLQGESGSGKEVLANFIHRLSGRKKMPLVTVNCAAIPSSLLESTLFGHEKGAFTGAHSSVEGYFSRAAGATLFLDEVGELSLEAQSKLLRVLETGDYQKVGGEKIEKANVRLIVASHRSLKECINAGTFRKDLYFRISSFPLLIPPLRDRTEDILPLSQSLLKELTHRLGLSYKGFSNDFNRQMLTYTWPGNVRELKNELEKALILCGGKKLQLHLEDHRFLKENQIKTFDEGIVDIISQALQQSGGRVQGVGGAAELLGMKAQTLYSKIRKYKLQ